MSKKEEIRLFLESLMIIGAIGYLFFESIVFIICLSPLTIFYMKKKKESVRSKRKWELNLQFKETLIGISAALNAGYSIENSLREAREDLLLIYDKNADMIKELDYMIRQLGRNYVVEELLFDLANRSQVEDIMDFAEVFATAKRSGGNLIKIIHSTCEKINDKIEVKREIQTMISGKKMEVTVMSLVPLGIIGYMKLFSPEFMACLYHNPIGAVIMAVGLLLYAGSVLLAEKIMDIEV